MEDFLQGVHPHEMTTGREDRPTVVAVAPAEPGVEPPGHLPPEPRLSRLNRLLKSPLPLPLKW